MNCLLLSHLPWGILVRLSNSCFSAVSLSIVPQSTRASANHNGGGRRGSNQATVCQTCQTFSGQANPCWPCYTFTCAQVSGHVMGGGGVQTKPLLAGLEEKSLTSQANTGAGRLWAHKALEGQAIDHKQLLALSMLCLLRAFRRPCKPTNVGHVKMTCTSVQGSGNLMGGGGGKGMQIKPLLVRLKEKSLLSQGKPTKMGHVIIWSPAQLHKG